MRASGQRPRQPPHPAPCLAERMGNIGGAFPNGRSWMSPRSLGWHRLSAPGRKRADPPFQFRDLDYDRFAVLATGDLAVFERLKNAGTSSTGDDRCLVGCDRNSGQLCFGSVHSL